MAAPGGIREGQDARLACAGVGARARGRVRGSGCLRGGGVGSSWRCGWRQVRVPRPRCAWRPCAAATRIIRPGDPAGLAFRQPGRSRHVGVRRPGACGGAVCARGWVFGVRPGLRAVKGRGGRRGGGLEPWRAGGDGEREMRGARRGDAGVKPKAARGCAVASGGLAPGSGDQSTAPARDGRPKRLRAAAPGGPAAGAPGSGDQSKVHHARREIQKQGPPRVTGDPKGDPRARREVLKLGPRAGCGRPQKARPPARGGGP